MNRNAAKQQDEGSGENPSECPLTTVTIRYVEAPDAERRLHQAIELLLGETSFYEHVDSNDAKENRRPGRKLNSHHKGRKENRNRHQE